MIETIIGHYPNVRPAHLRVAVSRVSAGDGARLFVRGDWVVYSGRTAAAAVGNLVRILQREIQEAL